MQFAVKSVAALLLSWPVVFHATAHAQSLSHSVPNEHPVTVTINNFEPRRDTNGEILDAHDGSLEFFEGRFYLYGTHYGDSNGLGDANYYVCYSSPDLIQWQFEGPLLPDAPHRIYYRPYVKFNRSTGKYVLWFDADNRYGVATSSHPAGPFVIHDPDVQVKYLARGVGDFGLFVDDDGSGYIAYTTLDLQQMKGHENHNPPHHRISVERLAPDYLSSTGENGGFIAGNVESPAMFKRNATYYLLFDNTCAFCKNGSGARVYTANSVLGRYVYRSNINAKGANQNGTRWTSPGSGRINTIVDAQQTHVAQIPSASGTIFMWMGDRWGSTPDGIKGHDFQMWLPLEFADDGAVRSLKKVDTWPLIVQLPQ
jgi:hypothetical protein